MQFYEPKEWPVGARSGQLDMTFVAFSIVLLRIGDLHQGHVRQCEAGGKDTTNRDGGRVQETGLSSSAEPSTGPIWVRNISLTREPRFADFGKQSKPPVGEMTSRLPVAQPPSWNRSTAGVKSVMRTRGGRKIGDGWGRQVMYLRRV